MFTTILTERRIWWTFCTCASLCRASPVACIYRKVWLSFFVPRIWPWVNLFYAADCFVFFTFRCGLLLASGMVPFGCCWLLPDCFFILWPLDDHTVLLPDQRR